MKNKALERGVPGHVAESKLREIVDARNALHDSIREKDESNRTSRKRRAADFSEPVIFVKAGAVKAPRSGDTVWSWIPTRWKAKLALRLLGR